MANQTIPGLSSLSLPSSATMAWINDPNASPQDRSLTLPALWQWLKAKDPLALASGASPFTLAAPFHSIYNVTTGASNFTFNLPAATGSGLTVEIVKADSGAGMVVIAPNGSNAIDKAGNVSVYLGYQFQSIKLTDMASGYWQATLLGKRSFFSTSGTFTVLGGIDADFILTGASTPTLPANPYPGQRLTFKAKTTATSTITANSGQTIGTTGSTSFLLYTQDDYVILEWDGSSIWYVAGTNGPLQISNQTARVTMTGDSTWRAIGNGLALSLNPGVYDISIDADLSGTDMVSLSIGNGTTSIANKTIQDTASGSVFGHHHSEVLGYVLGSSATINGIFWGQLTSTGYVEYNQVGSGCYGQIRARRIG